MTQLKFDVTGTDAEVRKELRKALRTFNDDALYDARFWWGFLFGGLLFSAMNFADFHICIGACGVAP
jgi:hypothetical protein